ncbi:MAG: hypothetical protein ACTSRW_06100 [Candidatus Helarchaeota archaeon]
MLELEGRIKIKRDWKNPLLAIIFTILGLTVLTLVQLMNSIILLELPSFISIYPYLQGFVSPQDHLNSVIFFDIASATFVIGIFFFLWFGLGTEKCNICVFGFGFGSSSAAIICLDASLCIYSHVGSVVFAVPIIILSLTCGIIGFILWHLRHEVDFIIINQFIPIDEEIREMNLYEVRCPYGILRLQRTLSRGIRAGYLNPYLYLDKGKLIRSDVKIIDKQYLYDNVKAPRVLLYSGLICCAISALILFLYFCTDSYLFFIIFGAVFGLGLGLIDYYFIRTLNLRKTILIIDHWLRRVGSLDLYKIDKDFGFLPIKYSISSLKCIVRRYQSFLNAKLVDDVLQMN